MRHPLALPYAKSSVVGQNLPPRPEISGWQRVLVPIEQRLMNRFLLATAAVLTLTLNSLCVQSVGEKTGMIFVLGIAPTTADFIK